MPTSFNTSRFTKVWFAKPGQSLLGGSLNEYRLRIHRSRFPNDEITLISNFEDFSKAEQEYVIQFCQHFRIKLMGLNAIQAKIKVSTTLQDQETQIALLNIARLEITHDCGNLAAASDIVRTLSPVAECGIYTDFDMIKKPMPITITSPLGFLLDGDFQGADFSLDKLSNAAFACNESATSFLRVYRKLMLERYGSVREIIQELDAKKTFDPSEYNLAKRSMSEFKQVESELPVALRFRAALKRSCTPKSYEKALKGLVEAISGPECMSVAFATMVTGEFLPFCREHKLDVEARMTEFENLSLIRKCPFLNQDDASWIPSMDKREATWKKITTEAATKIQSVLRMYQAKIAARKLKAEKLKSETEQPEGQQPLTLHVIN